MSDEQALAIAARLEAAAEELADLAIDRIRDALRGRSDDEPAADRLDERRITRARRAVEKAVVLLRSAEPGADDD